MLLCSHSVSSLNVSVACAACMCYVCCNPQSTTNNHFSQAKRAFRLAGLIDDRGVWSGGDTVCVQVRATPSSNNNKQQRQ